MGNGIGGRRVGYRRCMAAVAAAVLALGTAWATPPRPVDGRAVEKYLEQRAGAGEDAESQAALGKWCQRYHLDGFSEIHYERAVAAATDHEESRRALGHVRDGERWVPRWISERMRREALIEGVAWFPTADAARIREGKFPMRDRWIGKGEAEAFHRDVANPWLLHGTHYDLTSTLPWDDTLRILGALERQHDYFHRTVRPGLLPEEGGEPLPVVVLVNEQQLDSYMKLHLTIGLGEGPPFFFDPTMPRFGRVAFVCPSEPERQRISGYDTEWNFSNNLALVCGLQYAEYTLGRRILRYEGTHCWPMVGLQLHFACVRDDGTTVREAPLTTNEYALLGAAAAQGEGKTIVELDAMNWEAYESVNDMAEAYMLTRYLLTADGGRHTGAFYHYLDSAFAWRSRGEPTL